MSYGNGGTAAVGMQSAQDYRNVLEKTARPVIQQCLDAQENAIQGLHVAIDELEKRLMLIVDLEPPSGTGASVPTPNSPQILDRVQRNHNGIEAATSRLTRLMQRIQL